MAVHLPHLSDVEKLSSRVIRVLGGNPGHVSSNTYIVGTGSVRILIDTGAGRRIWIENIQNVLENEKATISQAVITHWHHDHVGGIKQLLDIAPNAVIYKNLPEHGQLEINDGQIFQVEGASIKAVLCPGHTIDHTAFILEEEDVLFTGDAILGHGTAAFEDLSSYLVSLRKLRSLCRGPIYPGHGSMIQDGPSKVLEYINHRQERENQVLEILSSINFTSNTSLQNVEHRDWTSTEIVRTLYADIADGLLLSAQRVVREILRKLKIEGRVIEINETERWRLNINSMEKS
ncbi:Lactamase-like protein nscB [Erysiphe neolycopersici]|uniref:Lactamase-like protein nscB n=1 Tax=Erysiphe neolycopersici TaxID=212602 RepID=A0A420HVL6_9PEZI|nr:Lactamase-like protein nscB [Erysiphe neolycopersici]